MKKTIIFGLLLLVMISSVNAWELGEDKIYNIEHGEEQFEFIMHGYGQMDMRLREGADVLIHVDSHDIQLVIESMNAKITRGTLYKNGEKESFNIELGEEQEITFDTGIPFILIEERIFHNSDTIEDKYIVLKIRNPFMGTWDGEGEVQLDPNAGDEGDMLSGIVSGNADDDVEKTWKEKLFDEENFKYYVIGVIVLLGILIWLGPKPRNPKKS